MTPRTLLVSRLTAIGAGLQAFVTRSVWPIVVGLGADLIVFAGVTAVTYGIWLIYRPTAFIFIGLVLILIAIRGGQPTKKDGEQ